MPFKSNIEVIVGYFIDKGKSHMKLQVIKQFRKMKHMHQMTSY